MSGSDLAGNATEGTYTPTELFAGEAKVITQVDEVADDIQKYQVVGKTDGGNIVPLDPAATDGSEVAYGIATQAVNAGSEYLDGRNNSVAVYVGGFFNHEALIWPASLGSLAARKKAFQGTGIQIGHVNGPLASPAA
jgi:hypothetical protein